MRGLWLIAALVILISGCKQEPGRGATGDDFETTSGSGKIYDRGGLSHHQPAPGKTNAIPDLGTETGGASDVSSGGQEGAGTNPAQKDE